MMWAGCFAFQQRRAQRMSDGFPPELGAERGGSSSGVTAELGVPGCLGCLSALGMLLLPSHCIL